MEPTETLYIAGAFVVGGGLAWWWRSRRDLPERMRLVEHFERRARLAESDQEQAIRTLNSNELRMRKVEGTYESLRTRIGQLEAALEKSESGQSTATEALRTRETDLTEARALLDELA